MKLMEEIVEFDQEIKLKQKWINSRMKLLHQIQKQQKPEMKEITNNFMKQIQPDYPRKLSVEYTRHENEAIPLKMADLIPEPIPMPMADKYPDAIPIDDHGEAHPKITEI